MTQTPDRPTEVRLIRNSPDPHLGIIRKHCDRIPGAKIKANPGGSARLTAATCDHLHSPVALHTEHFYFKYSLLCLILVHVHNLTAWETEAGGSSVLGKPGQHNVLWIRFCAL